MAESVKKTILIVEDEPSLRQALRDILSRKGFACLEANDGVAGLSAALEHTPDLIMLDLLMPKMDGMEMLKQLRADAWGKQARVLILTNLSADSSERVRDVVETTPDFYLIKSDWSINDIVKKTEEMLHT
jgi:DNA-binding response OmpR family regulator